MQSYSPKFIPNLKNQNRLAIGDIHGCYERFKKLLYYLNNDEYGYLTALDLDSFELYF